MCSVLTPETLHVLHYLVISIFFPNSTNIAKKVTRTTAPTFLMDATPLHEDGSWHSPVNLAKIVEKILLNTYLFMSNREKTNQIQFHSHCLLWT